ncbi:hypothetical protein PV326_002215 [Microctonus aethiopoides]|uniref:F-box domain-containing protein n=1 Tax=Microctonus aethiopoides TaxID=144406 RepID=A0AA39FXL6_9HYME|nr:hypothetical protein PV326_002215 [Microctonus aethiopoides]KAK0177486.1 hypothetical protein PV328_001536 [Microctonus aethiopoides]
MEAFGNLMSIIGATMNPTSVDFLNILPVEISQIVFRQLDERSLLNAAKVSRRWRNVCRGDPHLRQTANSYLQREKERLYEVTPSEINPKKIQSSNISTDNVKKFKRTCSRIATAQSATFRFGPSGITSGLLANPKKERNFRPKQSAALKRNICKFR